MGTDFTSHKYPFFTSLQEDESGEGHLEPGDESIRSNVVGYEHPLFSTSGLKKYLNGNISLSASDEKKIEGDIQEKVLKDYAKAAFKQKFPFDALIMAADFEEKLDKRSSGSDAESIISQLTSNAKELLNTLGRQPYNYEVFMSYALGSVANAKKVIDQAKSKPDEKAKPLGTKKDGFIFYKNKLGTKELRTNKQVLQYFKKRTVVGLNVFPHLPLGTST